MSQTGWQSDESDDLILPRPESPPLESVLAVAPEPTSTKLEGDGVGSTEPEGPGGSAKPGPAGRNTKKCTDCGLGPSRWHNKDCPGNFVWSENDHCPPVTATPVPAALKAVAENASGDGSGAQPADGGGTGTAAAALDPASSPKENAPLGTCGTCGGRLRGNGKGYCAACRKQRKEAGDPAPESLAIAKPRHDPQASPKALPSNPKPLEQPAAATPPTAAPAPSA